MKRVFSLVVGLALVFSFNACNDDLEEGGVKNVNVKKTVDVAKIAQQVGAECFADFEDAGFTQKDFNAFGQKVNLSGNGKREEMAPNIWMWDDNKNSKTYLFFDEDATGFFTIFYKKGNYYAFMNFKVDCLLEAGIDEIVFCTETYSNLRFDYDPGVTVDPITVNLGFIGHYLFDGKVMTTSFHWQELKEGDCIDWEAVDAAWAEWTKEGSNGLDKDESNGWRTSGFAPIFFDRPDENGNGGLCHGDLSFPQLEGFYRAYFVSTGYVLPNTGPVEIPGQTGNCMLDETVLDKIGDWIGNERVVKKAPGYHLVDCYTRPCGLVVYKCTVCEWETGLPPQLPGEPIKVIETSKCAPVVVSFERYKAYVEIWNDWYLAPIDVVSDALKTILRNDGGMAHYQALLAAYGAASLPSYYAFDDKKKDLFDHWANILEVGLKKVAAELDFDLFAYVIAHPSNQ